MAEQQLFEPCPTRVPHGSGYGGTSKGTVPPLSSPTSLPVLPEEASESYPEVDGTCA